MKKLSAFVAAVSLFVSGAALSENLATQPTGYWVNLGYQYQDNTSDLLTESNQYQIGAGYTPYEWLELGLTTKNVMSKDVLDYNQLEGSATGYYGFTDMVGAYGRGELGQTWTSVDDFSYGAIGVGGYIKPYGPTSNTQIQLGYRYRDSFNDVDYATNSLVLGAEYAFTPVHSVTVGYEYVDGDSNDLLDQNLFSIGYRGHF